MSWWTKKKKEPVEVPKPVPARLAVHLKNGGVVFVLGTKFEYPSTGLLIVSTDGFGSAIFNTGEWTYSEIVPLEAKPEPAPAAEPVVAEAEAVRA